MTSRSHTALAPLTTLQIGGPASRMVDLDLEAHVVDAVHDADARGEPMFVLGEGSNVVVADAGFPGLVARMAIRGVDLHRDRGLAFVDVAAGENWDAFVARAVDEGWRGVECLSGIPGLVGATPIQNVGAYGREVAEVVTRVRVFDRQSDLIQVIPNDRCSFTYRSSLFKSAPRYVVLGVSFLLARQALSMPVKYAELATELGVEMGERAGVGEVRSSVLKIRARKGMVLNPGDQDTRSAGSFFTNPVLTTEEYARVEAAAAARAAGPVPRYEAGTGLVKVPAAWLIEQAGFAKGYGTPGRARISSKHTLALVNADGATTADLLALAREIRAGVRSTFGVTLTPEPILVGVTL